MKPTHKLLFVLCPMLVLGFIYYSSGRLHLYVWGQKPQKDAEETTVELTKGAEVKGIAELGNDINAGRIVSSVYDKQGFLLQLETKLPPELAYKYGNLSEGVCKPGYAAAKMTSIYPKFIKPAPMFLNRNFKRLAKISSYLPPFGIKTQERIIDNILINTKNYGLGEELESLNCKRCIIVGNGGILYNKSLGSRIDEYDVVVRLNEAPVSGYKRDVGTKTTLRITYPEGAIQKPDIYEEDSLFVFSAFKPLDFKWLKQMVFKEKLFDFTEVKSKQPPTLPQGTPRRTKQAGQPLHQSEATSQSTLHTAQPRPTHRSTAPPQPTDRAPKAGTKIQGNPNNPKRAEKPALAPDNPQDPNASPDPDQ
ncbi:hypothetical protein CRENBAI_021988 [Crenichthys baileyi]|uniref:CMP-N-acetylneuraminate-beta-1,4-galactoside alpha-2,3-sialyltransferase n=1 Tax=Crenichthys baileyi TaxID=28760 RepID=A0AAV9SA77_9TELE